MKRNRIFEIVLAAFLLLFALEGRGIAHTYEVIFANYFAPDHPGTKTMQIFKEKFEAAAGEQVRVTLKPNNEAGGEEQIMELVKRGTLQIAMVGGLIKDDEPVFGAWEQPFIIEDWEHAKSVFFNKDIKRFEGRYTEKTGVLIKGYVVNGFRQVSCSFPLNHMADFGKMRIRIPLNEVFVEKFRALGAKPIPLPMTELYTALETKMVDGQDNPYSMVKSMGWWKVQKFMLETRHVFSPTFVLVNKKFYEGLTDILQTSFDAAMEEAVKANWELSIADEKAAREFMQSRGVSITVPDATFMRQMRDTSKKVYTMLDQKVPEAREFRDFCASMKP